MNTKRGGEDCGEDKAKSMRRQVCFKTSHTIRWMNSRAFSLVHSDGTSICGCVVFYTAAYNASISSSYSMMIACLRAVFFAVYMNGFFGDVTSIILGQQSQFNI